jgi:predicted nucleic-acid-binding Zn-ribbon protein
MIMADEPRPRPTAQELANQTNGGSFCPKCGAHEWRGQMNARVESTRHPDGRIVTVRRRICQCGQHAFRTEEVIVPDGCKVVVVREEE